MTFTADVLHGGLTPKFQWYKNRQEMIGARYATWVTSGLYFGDRVSVKIISEDPCSEIKEAADTVTIGHPTGIGSTDNGKTAMSLYPNPNRGSFTVSGVYGKEVGYAITNAIGQVIRTGSQQNVNGTLKITTQLPQGVYLIRINNDSGSSTAVLRFTVTE